MELLFEKKTSRSSLALVTVLAVVAPVPLNFSPQNPKIVPLGIFPSHI